MRGAGGAAQHQLAAHGHGAHRLSERVPFTVPFTVAFVALLSLAFPALASIALGISIAVTASIACSLTSASEPARMRLLLIARSIGSRPLPLRSLVRLLVRIDPQLLQLPLRMRCDCLILALAQLRAPSIAPLIAKCSVVCIVMAMTTVMVMFVALWVLRRAVPLPIAHASACGGRSKRLGVQW